MIACGLSAYQRIAKSASSFNSGEVELTSGPSGSLRHRGWGSGYPNIVTTSLQPGDSAVHAAITPNLTSLFSLSTTPQSHTMEIASARPRRGEDHSIASVINFHPDSSVDAPHDTPNSDDNEREITTDRTNNPRESSPELFHRVQHHSSILALAVSDKYIYAGTQDGEILAWSLGSYELVLRIQAHRRAVLCLHLSQDGKLLFSSAGDAIVNAWCPYSLKRIYHIYSTYDVGDLFSVAYSTQFETAYFGAQNTSIQWCSLKDSQSRPQPNDERHPDKRNHRFFDSKAAGGTSTPRPPFEGRSSRLATGGETVEVDKSHMKHYAHFGYVYCMLMVRGASRLVEPDEDMLISGGGDGTIKLWKLSADPDAGIEELACLGEDDAESVLSLALDGSFLYSGKLRGVIELWDLDTKQKLRVIRAHNGDVMTLQMDWGFLFSAGATGYSRVSSCLHSQPRFHHFHMLTISPEIQHSPVRRPLPRLLLLHPKIPMYQPLEIPRRQNLGFSNNNT